jgi:hypothetical protein
MRHQTLPGALPLIPPSTSSPNPPLATVKAQITTHRAPLLSEPTHLERHPFLSSLELPRPRLAPKRPKHLHLRQVPTHSHLCLSLEMVRWDRRRSCRSQTSNVRSQRIRGRKRSMRSSSSQHTGPFGTTLALPLLLPARPLIRPFCKRIRPGDQQ